MFGLETPETRRVLRERREQLGPQRRALREARGQVEDALEADPYRPEALQAALLELRKKTTAMQAEVHGALVDLSSELTPERRRELVEKSLRGHRRHRPRDGRD
jgi:uncharacterized membrane protein